MARSIEVVSATRFSRGLTADSTVYLGFIEVTKEGQLNFMHCATHGTESQEVRIGDAGSECLLDDMEASFPYVFM